MPPPDTMQYPAEQPESCLITMKDSAVSDR